MYLKRDGTQVEHLPVLDDYAKEDVYKRQWQMCF